MPPFQPSVRAPWRLLCAFTIIALTAFWQGQPAQAVSSEPLYRLTDLGTLGGSMSGANDINDAGVVVGDALLPGDTIQHGFVWSRGVMRDLGALRPNLNSHAGAVNDAGQIAGSWDVSEVPSPDNTICFTPGPCHTVLWTGGVPQDLGTLGGLNSNPNDLNDRSQVVGVAEPADSAPFAPCGSSCRPRKPTLWDRGTAVILADLGGPSGSARGVNNQGEIVGRSDLSATIDPAFRQTDFHATLWYRGHVTDLGTLAGGRRSYAYDINERSQVVGRSYVGGDTIQHGFIWEHGRMTDLGTLPGDQQSNAEGINDRGQIVGDSCPGSCDDETRGYLWDNGKMIDLSAHIQDNTAWTVVDAAAMNDRGQIVGFGISPTGNGHAILLTPMQYAPAAKAVTTSANVTASSSSFTVYFSSQSVGQGSVLFGSGPGCLGLVETATRDEGAGTTSHTVRIEGNDLPGTVGDNGIIPGSTYWYEAVTVTKAGVETDNNGGKCYSVTVPTM